jgi:hypothetical protein
MEFLLDILSADCRLRRPAVNRDRTITDVHENVFFIMFRLGGKEASTEEKKGRIHVLKLKSR